MTHVLGKICPADCITSLMDHTWRGSGCRRIESQALVNDCRHVFESLDAEKSDLGLGAICRQDFIAKFSLHLRVCT